MARQSRRRQEQLIAQFPIVGSIRLGETADSFPTEFRIHVQLADPRVMHLKAKNWGNWGYSYLTNWRWGENRRGQRYQYLMAMSKSGQPEGSLCWENWKADGQSLKTAKDIFQYAQSNCVSYLVWVSKVDWHEPAAAKIYRDEDGSLKIFGKALLREVTIVVYLKPKRMSWEQLVEQAEDACNGKSFYMLFPAMGQPYLELYQTDQYAPRREERS